MVVSECSECQQANPQHLFVCRNCPCADDYSTRSEAGCKIDDPVNPKHVTFYVCNSSCQKLIWKRHKIEHKLSPFGGVFRVCNGEEYSRMVTKEKCPKWIVDAYRLRVEDDYAFGGGNLHGLYEAATNFEASPLEKRVMITKDFILYMKLAVRCGEIKGKQDGSEFWDELATAACGRLPYAYEQSDCQKDWGQFAYSPMRMTAENIYGSNCMSAMFQDSDENVLDVERKVDRLFRFIDNQIFEGSLTRKKMNKFWARADVNNFLMDVGGAKTYKKIAEEMEDSLNLA